jgi:hypothetical protein
MAVAPADSIQELSWAERAKTIWRDAVEGRKTGRPLSLSHRCTVRTPRPKKAAISFQELSI